MVLRDMIENLFNDLVFPGVTGQVGVILVIWSPIGMERQGQFQHLRTNGSQPAFGVGEDLVHSAVSRQRQPEFRGILLRAQPPVGSIKTIRASISRTWSPPFASICTFGKKPVERAQGIE